MARQNRNVKTDNRLSQQRAARGNDMITQDQRIDAEKINITIKPNIHQQPIVDSMKYNYCTIVNGKSGTGKTTTAVGYALKLFEEKQFRKLVFVKNPTEAGDDKIGFLTGGKDEKLNHHFEMLKPVFLQFMSLGKFESLVNKGNLQLTIPNFMLGATLSDTILIIDEAQLISPKIIKMLLERCDDSSIAVVLGDSGQRYAADKRNDGLSDLIAKVTETFGGKLRSKDELFGYVELSHDANMRGKLSQRIGQLYD